MCDRIFAIGDSQTARSTPLLPLRNVYAHPGSDTKKILQRLPAIMRVIQSQRGADTIFLMAGTVDVIRGVDSTETVRNIKKMVTHLLPKLNGGTVIICGVPNIGGSRLDQQIQAVNRGLRRLAEEFYGARYFSTGQLPTVCDTRYTVEKTHFEPESLQRWMLACMRIVRENPAGSRLRVTSSKNGRVVQFVNCR